MEFIFYIISWNSIQIFNNLSLIYTALLGNTNIAKLLLSRPEIDINCKDIEIKVYFIYPNLFPLIIYMCILLLLTLLSCNY